MATKCLIEGSKILCSSQDEQPHTDLKDTIIMSKHSSLIVSKIHATCKGDIQITIFFFCFFTETDATRKKEKKYNVHVNLSRCQDPKHD